MKKLLLTSIILLVSYLICLSQIHARYNAQPSVTLMDSIAFETLRNSSEACNLSLIPMRLPSSLELQILHEVLDFDREIYNGDWADTYYSQLGGNDPEKYIECVSEGDESFCYSSWVIKNHTGEIVTCFYTPLSCFSFLSFKCDNGKWETSPVRMPGLYFFISDQGYVAGVEENGDQWHVSLEFFKIDNFNGGKKKTIVPLGRYSSLHRPPSGIDYLYIPNSDGDKGFWMGDRFFLKCNGALRQAEYEYSIKDLYLCFDLGNSSEKQ